VLEVVEKLLRVYRVLDTPTVGLVGLVLLFILALLEEAEEEAPRYHLMGLLLGVLLLTVVVEVATCGNMTLSMVLQAQKVELSTREAEAEEVQVDMTVEMFLIQPLVVLESLLFVI
jgi:hypothetical protein